MSMHQHKLYDREDDLRHCMVCGGAEASMPTMCPGRMMTAQEQDAVQNNRLDFSRGPGIAPQWWFAVGQLKPTEPHALIAVDARALHDVLSALQGPSHLIRELQAIQGLPPLGGETHDPIGKLSQQYNAWTESAK